VVEYKFVLDGDRWIHDPANPERVEDGVGGPGNSVLRLGRLASLLGDEGGNARSEGIEVSALLHDPGLMLYRQLLSDGRLLLRYRSLVGDLDRVELAVRGDAERPELERVLSTDAFDFWELVLEAPGDPSAALEYTFVVEHQGRRHGHPEQYECVPETLSYFATPDWAKRAVWYQVFLDRFRNGDSANDPEPVREWTSEWFSAADFEGADGQTFWEYYVYQRKYGGDLRGLIEALDYLESLGVNALYLNPIFQASTPHKYNATNYVHVDEHFGTKGDYAPAEAAEDVADPATWTWTESDKLFLEFLKLAKGRGFRVILDGVWNHVGTAHPAFKDVERNGKRSKYADWFEIRSWRPFEYAGWAGFGELPVFAKSPEGLASDGVKQHIFDVTRRWMDPDGDGDPSDGIDGWRLDVPNEIAMPFWEEWCALVREINPEAYITGEIWRRADAWLDGKHFDAVMNYPFAESVIRWVGDVARKIGPSELDRRLAELRLAYPSESTYVLQNLVDSHDTDRLVSMLANPDREYDSMNRPQNDADDYDGSKPGELEYRRARLIALVQMTYVGAPMVYYGDEVGMWGADDPTNRKPMLWKDLEPYDQPDENAVMDEHLEHYRRVITLRRSHEALQVGSFQTLLADDERDLWAFVRETADEQVVVLLNASGRPAAVDREELFPAGEGEFRSVLGDEGRDRPGQVWVGSIDGRVWVRER
jgi:cyclomaltodextrinase